MYSSAKSKRASWSGAAGETLAFIEGFDTTFVIWQDLPMMFVPQIPILMLTYSNYSLNVLGQEDNLIAPHHWITVISEAYKKQFISNIVLIDLEHSPANGLTKIESDNALMSLLHTQNIDDPIRPFVIKMAIRATWGPAYIRTGVFDRALLWRPSCVGYDTWALHR